MKKQAIVKQPRQKSISIRLRPDQIKTILTSATALMMATVAEDSTSVKVDKLRSLALPAYKEIAIELGRNLMREVKEGRLFNLSVDMSPVMGYFKIYVTHDDGSHELGQTWKITVTHPSMLTRFQHEMARLGSGDAAMKEMKKL